MLVFGKSRSKADEEVTLEEDDVTEDLWEKPYTELLGDTLGSTTLQRSLSARVRRRERVLLRYTADCNDIANLTIWTVNKYY